MTASAPIAGAPIAGSDDEAESTVHGCIRVTLAQPFTAIVTLAQRHTVTVSLEQCMSHVVGNSVDPTALFKVDGTATDPTTVTLRIKTPAGDESVLIYGTDDEVERVSAGSYRSHVSLTTPGRWVFRWEGTGACEAAAESILDVTASKFAGVWT